MRAWHHNESLLAVVDKTVSVFLLTTDLCMTGSACCSKQHDNTMKALLQPFNESLHMAKCSCPHNIAYHSLAHQNEIVKRIVDNLPDHKVADRQAQIWCFQQWLAASL